jgi:hypothetical protein
MVADIGYFNQVGSGLTHNHYTRLKKLARATNTLAYYKH